MSIVLGFHIFAGCLALCAGFAALFVCKGSVAHRASGSVFVLSMLLMSLSGAYLALYIPEYITVLNGLFTAYLVLTAWLTVQQRYVVSEFVSLLLMLLSASVGLAMVFCGVFALNSINGELQGFGPEPFWFFGSVALLASALDIRGRLSTTLTAIQKLTRHLWRMCFALFIAAASFFLGQQQVFPEVLQDSVWLGAPVLLCVLLLGYWLLRLRAFKKPLHR